MKTKHRHGDTMLLIESESAVVDFSDIVDSCRVEHDDYSEPPWEDCDGYKHEKLTLRHPDQSAANGFCRPNRAQAYMVRVDQDQSLYNWYRMNGASRQVARERTAASMKQRTNQLVKWIEDGWESLAVICEYGGCYHSLHGILDPESDDIDQIKVELAEECAAELVAQGYTVENRPTLADHRKEYLRNRKDGYKRNVTLF